MSFKLESRIPQLTTDLRKRASELVRKTAFTIEGRAKLAAPVDVGFLRNSIYVSTSDGGNYAERVAEAQAVLSKAKKGNRNFLPEEKPESDLAAIVAVGAEYGPHIEFGTAHQSARPFLGLAFDATESEFQQGMKELLK